MKRLLIWASVVLITVVLMGGCADTTGYKTFTEKNGLDPFSFEYNGYYKIFEALLTNGQDRQDGGVYYLNLSDIRAKNGEHYTTIYIESWIPKNYPDAHALFDAQNSTPVLAGLELLDQFVVTIDGVEAKGISYKINVPINPSGTQPKEEYHVQRSIYFDHKGLIWELNVGGLLSEAASDKADFDHILQTFKFLP